MPGWTRTVIGISQIAGQAARGVAELEVAKLQSCKVARQFVSLRAGGRAGALSVSATYNIEPTSERAHARQRRCCISYFHTRHSESFRFQADLLSGRVGRSLAPRLSWSALWMTSFRPFSQPIWDNRLSLKRLFLIVF